MIEFVKCAFFGFLIIMFNVQVFIYIFSADSTYFQAWKKTCTFLLNALALQNDQDRKTSVTALLLMTYIVGGTCALELLNST